MLRDAFNLKVLFVCVLLLGISSISALARVDNNWSSHTRPNFTVAGYRPAVVHNQTQWHAPNNHSLAIYMPAAPISAQKNVYRPPEIAHNQTRPLWQQPGLGNYTVNQTRPLVPQYPLQGQGIFFNQTRPSTVSNNHPQYPFKAEGTLNQSRPVWPQPAVANFPQFPANGQGKFIPTNRPHYLNYPQYPANRAGTFNHIRPLFPQTPQYPSSGQISLNQTSPQPLTPPAHIYPLLTNSSNTKPVISSNAWTPAANQTLIYPQLTQQNNPPPVPNSNTGGVPLAPLHPIPPNPQSPQGPPNWQASGQAILSYGPGHYPAAPPGNSNKSSPPRQGSSNPYANMFI